MAFRNTHRVGDWLMLDDESGAVHYRSDMRKIWDGTWRHKSMFETRQPQEFIKARNDPRALRHVRPEPVFASVQSTVAFKVGNTNVNTNPSFPGSGSIFNFGLTSDLGSGIGVMVIEGSVAGTPFIVS
jgi:hypothetical protein